MPPNTLISNLLSERSNFILIGLTGRTGSGCSTASKLLCDDNLIFPKENEIYYEQQNFFSGLDKKRYSIVRDYAQKNHTSFKLIKISDFITAKLLNISTEEFQNLLHKVVEDHFHPKISESKILEEFDKIKQELQNDIELKEFYEYLISNNEITGTLNTEKWQNFISQTTIKIKESLKVLGNCYVKLYQHIGDSIRKTALIQTNFTDLAFNPEGLHILPKMINKLIKTYRTNSNDQSTYIVIDAIRNPYEAKFFKDRYAAFYLISIDTPSKDRKKFLQDKYKLNINQISDLDEKESGKLSRLQKDTLSDDHQKYHELITANVKKCIEISDIHIFNPRNEPNNHNILKAQLAWYLSLIKHPGLITPTSMERAMQIAYTAKLNSGCISRQVGATVTDQNYSIKAVGWNDVPKGVVPCNLRSLDELVNYSSETSFSEYERYNENFQKKAKEKLISLTNIPDGRKKSYCFKDLQNSIDGFKNQVHTRSLHAEENAFLQISKYGGTGIEGGKLFTTASPCELCAKKAYQLGINEIIYIDPYPGLAIQHILHVGENQPKLILFRGAIGKAYQQLYEPLMPYKDELEFLS